MGQGHSLECDLHTPRLRGGYGSMSTVWGRACGKQNPQHWDPKSRLPLSLSSALERASPPSPPTAAYGCLLQEASGAKDSQLLGKAAFCPKEVEKQMLWALLPVFWPCLSGTSTKLPSRTLAL